jgi:CCR4-NOT transcriptional regulation complex NOT5 subunit
LCELNFSKGIDEDKTNQRESKTHAVFFGEIKMNDQVKMHLEQISDDELKERVEKNYYAEENLDLVMEEVKKRGIKISSEGVHEVKTSFIKEHPIMSLVIAGLVSKVLIEIIKRLTH